MKTARELLEDQLKDARWNVNWHKERLQKAENEVEAFEGLLDQPELGNGGEPIPNPNPEPISDYK